MCCEIMEHIKRVLDLMEHICDVTMHLLSNDYKSLNRNLCHTLIRRSTITTFI